MGRQSKIFDSRPPQAAAAGGHYTEIVRRWLPLAIPLGLAIFLALYHITVGEFGPSGTAFGDEKTHACSGLFIASLLRDLPLRHPVAYTYHYYAQYPALGVVQYPPLFYLAEGLLFLIFTPSVLVARLAIMFFTLLAVYFWYRIVKELAGEKAAGFSAALLVCLPGILPYEKAAMLEIPTLALCIAASYFWIRYLREGRAKLLYTFALVASLALLTKQNAMYLPVFCLLSALACRRWRLLWIRKSLYAFLIVCALAGPAYFTEIAVQWHSLRIDMSTGLPPLAHKLPLGQWLYYPSTLPKTLGWPMLILAIGGLLSSKWWPNREARALMLAWIAACWLTLGSIPHQEARYACYWLPPFVYFAVTLIGSLCARGRLRPLAFLAAAGLLIFYAAKAWSYQRPYVSGYAAAAREITGRGYHGVVLADIQLSGNFIFFVRKNDLGRHIVVMRKGLYVERYLRAMGYQVLADSRQQILSLLAKYGVRYIVVEKGMPIEFPVQNLLRDLLHTPQFREIGSFPIRSNEPEWHGRSLTIYGNLQAGPPTAKTYTVKMLTINHDIVVPMSGLFR